MEVNSKDNGDDRVRMLLQWACLVRLVNELLDEKNMKRDFIVMAFYFDQKSEFERYFLYQDENRTEPDGGMVRYSCLYADSGKS